MSANTQAGFTLIELVITLTVLSIVLALAAAGVGDTIRNAQLMSAAESIQNGLQLARTQAVQSNALVSWTLGDKGSWTVKYEGTNGTIVQGPSEAYGTLDVTPKSTVVVFNGLGALKKDDPSVSIDIKPSTGTCLPYQGGLRCFGVRVSVMGQIKRCDPSLAASDPKSCD